MEKKVIFFIRGSQDYSTWREEGRKQLLQNQRKQWNKEDWKRKCWKYLYRG
ncbi:hypothetical protein [Thermoflavimicrobium daqui]|jgi:hypothetical protein|uniref:hypothetical protein n=1 Tax=Thermoflavimicrobium daqui TaxID=2137476 RepID=UPI00143DFD16|nr:hypothetical protein [Thermoflavimicrobium daqui]